MTYSRSEPTYNQDTRQTDQPSGCLSGFLIPPLIALCFGLFLALGTSGLKTPDVQPEVHAASGTIVVNGSLAPLFTPEIQFWSANITRWASEHGLDPNLAATVMQIESCGNPSARSSAGASGLFQVMPYHFAAGDDPYDPDTNAKRGLAYLKRSL